ncbi:hypothetical protein GCM10010485_80260 [Streptosporangium carneum]
MQDDEHLVWIGVHFGHTVAYDAVLDRHRMKAEHLRQHTHGLLVAAGDVHPDQAVLTLKQRRQFLDGTLLDPFTGDQTNVHPAPTPHAILARVGQSSVLD